ncbi:MAG: hypothetical protein K2X38_23380 [Gemmataceae bacterium]|nr:hypothetical protein [Gemmataceae bacterium]
MKRFVVEWLPTAEEQLAAIWSTAQEPDEITESSHLIDKVLEQTPLESTTAVDGYCFLRRGTLVALCPVDKARRIVTVVEVKAADAGH